MRWHWECAPGLRTQWHPNPLPYTRQEWGRHRLHNWRDGYLTLWCRITAVMVMKIPSAAVMVMKVSIAVRTVMVAIPSIATVMGSSITVFVIMETFHHGLNLSPGTVLVETPRMVCLNRQLWPASSMYLEIGKFLIGWNFHGWVSFARSKPVNGNKKLHYYCDANGTHWWSWFSLILNSLTNIKVLMKLSIVMLMVTVITTRSCDEQRYWVISIFSEFWMHVYKYGHEPPASSMTFHAQWTERPILFSEHALNNFFVSNSGSQLLLLSEEFSSSF